MMESAFNMQGLQCENVLIFGKGPSFRAELAKELRDRLYRKNGILSVYCVNETAKYVLEAGVNPDVVVCNDFEPMQWLANHAETKERFQRLAFPCYVHQKEKPATFETTGLFHAELLADRVYRYDLFTCPKTHFHPPCSIVQGPTTYCTALQLACYYGAKNVYTNGIDGGTDRHELYVKTNQLRPADYSAQFGREAELQGQYGLGIYRQV